MTEDREKQAEPKLGEVLAGKYRLERVVGEGGMGTVFAAHHEVLDQTVAVKILAPDLASSREIAERFLQEARAAAKLQSEHVARVMDAGETEGGLTFIVMECLEGFDLGHFLKEGQALPATDVVDYALEALEGLAHAHRAGIVHRDIKPGNLFLARRPGAPSVIKVLDFGISKATKGRSGKALLTQGHQIIGSPGYMSPEQVRDPSTVDGRSDVWSLGIVMYELLTGKPAFEGEGPMKILSSIGENAVAPLGEVRGDLPEGLADIVMRCIDRDRDRRYRDVAEVAAALGAYASPGHAPLVGRIETLMRDVAKPTVMPHVPASTRDEQLASTLLGDGSASGGPAPTRPPEKGIGVAAVLVGAAALVVGGAFVYVAMAGGEPRAPSVVAVDAAAEAAEETPTSAPSAVAEPVAPTHTPSPRPVSPPTPGPPASHSPRMKPHAPIPRHTIH